LIVPVIKAFPMGLSVPDGSIFFGRDPSTPASTITRPTTVTAAITAHLQAPLWRPSADAPRRPG
jgi:hypothetical protein